MSPGRGDGRPIKTAATTYADTPKNVAGDGSPAHDGHLGYLPPDPGQWTGCDDCERPSRAEYRWLYRGATLALCRPHTEFYLELGRPAAGFGDRKASP